MFKKIAKKIKNNLLKFKKSSIVKENPVLSDVVDKVVDHAEKVATVADESVSSIKEVVENEVTKVVEEAKKAGRPKKTATSDSVKPKTEKKPVTKKAAPKKS